MDTPVEFAVPQRLVDLEHESSGSHVLYAANAVDVAELGEADVRALVEGAKARLLDSLCSNLSVLNTATASLLGTFSADDDADAAVASINAHRTALKVYVYFLCTILTCAENEWHEQNTSDVTSSQTARGRKKPKPASASWNWEELREKVMDRLAAVLDGDLFRLYRMQTPDVDLLGTFSRAAFLLLEKAAVMRNTLIKQLVTRILVTSAVKYNQVLGTVSSLVHSLHNHEHLPPHAADIAATAAREHADPRLALDLIREVARIPANARETPGVKHVGEFIQELATRLPKLVATNLSVLLPLLNCSAYPLRSGMVAAIGVLIVNAFTDAEQTAGGEHARLQSKQGLLNILVERARDTSVWTRSEVMKTWANLCAQKAIPLGQWMQVSQLAAGRLQDKTANVRKLALRLLATMLQYNPFGPTMVPSQYETTLNQYQAKLTAQNPSASSAAQPDIWPKSGDAEPDTSCVTDDQAETGSSSVAGEDAAAVEDVPDENSSSVPQFEGGNDAIRHLVASLKVGLQFAKLLACTMPVLCELLTSSSVTDVTESIQYLVLAHQFQVDNTHLAIYRMLPMVFSKESVVQNAVVEACLSLYMKGQAEQTAQRLIDVAVGAPLGTLTALEEAVAQLTRRTELKSSTVRELWTIFATGKDGSEARHRRGALMVLSMAAVAEPSIVKEQLHPLLAAGFGPLSREDPHVARYACVALQRVTGAGEAPSPLAENHAAFGALSKLLLDKHLPDSHWYGAAEQAVKAIYALHPHPEALSTAVLQHLAMSVGIRSGCDEQGSDSNASPGEPVNVAALSRFFFALGQVALQQLVYAEACVRRVRRSRAAEEKAAAQAAAEAAEAGVQQPKQQASWLDIAEELGASSMQADIELDDMRDACEKEIVGAAAEESNRDFVALYAPIVQAICSKTALLQQHPNLHASVILAMCKLMAIDSEFCDRNLRLLFTIVQNSPATAVRSNCIIALGDLAFRFPNLVEPWTEHMYQRLRDTCPGVRKNALMVLTHLILNDMLKVKGHISEMALCLEDESPRIAGLARLFFHELSQKSTSPVYNLMPDMLSSLSSAGIPSESFHRIMTCLLGFIKKDKQSESLVEKLCNRLGSVTGKACLHCTLQCCISPVGSSCVVCSEFKQQKDIAYCMSLLNFTDKGVKKLADSFRTYQHLLHSEEILGFFLAYLSKGKKQAKADVRAVIEELEEKLHACHKERQEDEAVVEKAQTTDAKRLSTQDSDEPGSPSMSAAASRNATVADAREEVTSTKRVRKKPVAKRAQQQRRASASTREAASDGAEESNDENQSAVLNARPTRQAKPAAARKAPQKKAAPKTTQRQTRKTVVESSASSEVSSASSAED
eukprot:jgi/Chlat1/3525/Chrsp23S03800